MIHFTNPKIYIISCYFEHTLRIVIKMNLKSKPKIVSHLYKEFWENIHTLIHVNSQL